MKQASRSLSALALCLGLVSCSQGGAPQNPAAPALVTLGSEAGGFVMATSQGLAPEGFELKMRLDPHPGEDGVIREGSPVTVEVDLCGSVVEPGKTAHFLFDFNDDDIAEISGTGDACVQKHTYRAPADAATEVVLESNVCVTNGDPAVHNGSVYFSCRTVRVGFPKATGGSGRACTPGEGAPDGCLNLLSDADGALSIGWGGGTGPGEAFGFEGPDCENEIGDAIIVWACSDSEANALCEGAEPTGGIFTNGQELYFCPDEGDKLKASVPGKAPSPGTGRGRWTTR